eukprot:s374_g49.t1
MSLGLDWEIYLLLFGCAGASLLIQAVLAVAWLKPGDRFDATAFAMASFSSMAPFVSDQFDTLKDVIFGGLCLQSQQFSMKIVGVLSWSYLLAFHAWFFYLARPNPGDAPGANCFNELATSHLSVLLIAPKVQGEWSGGCWEGHHLLIENIPQALMSVLFLTVEGGSFFVTALNLVIPAVQIVLTFLLFKPVRAAAIPALGKRLSRAMKSGNTLAANALWEEAEIKGDTQLFKLMLPHLTFFLDATKSCGFMSEELKDLDKLSYEELKILLGMAAVFAGEARCYITDRKIGNSGAKVVAEALRNSPTETLDLRSNEIGDQGVEALAESLKSNGSLKELALGGNSIGDRGAEAVAEGLKSNGSLKDLWLWYNNIGDRGAEALAESLKSNGSLKLLALGGNSIGDRGAEALAAGLLQNRSLWTLSLSKFGSNLWHCCGSRGTPGYKALEEAQKIKNERGENLFIICMPPSLMQLGYGPQDGPQVLRRQEGLATAMPIQRHDKR